MLFVFAAALSMFCLLNGSYLTGGNPIGRLLIMVFLTFGLIA